MFFHGLSSYVRVTSEAIQAIAVALGCTSQVEGKHLLLKALYTLDAGLG